MPKQWLQSLQLMRHHPLPQNSSLPQHQQHQALLLHHWFPNRNVWYCTLDRHWSKSYQLQQYPCHSVCQSRFPAINIYHQAHHLQTDRKRSCWFHRFGRQSTDGHPKRSHALLYSVWQQYILRQPWMCKCQLLSAMLRQPRYSYYPPFQNVL